MTVERAKQIRNKPSSRQRKSRFMASGNAQTCPPGWIGKLTLPEAEQLFHRKPVSGVTRGRRIA